MIIRQQKQYNVLLVGDSCQDIYHYGSCERISPEAPVPILKEHYQEIRGGMSHNVKNNLQSFGIEVDFITNLELIKKHRFVDIKTKAHLLRADEGEMLRVKSLTMFELADKKYDAVIISDYDKGFITEETGEDLTRKFRDIPVFVDSKKKDLGCFFHSTIKLNEKEFKDCYCADHTSEIITTLGSRGARYRDTLFPTNKVEVHDVCGAGDVFLAALVFYFLETKDMTKAIECSNKLASLSVTKFGTHVLTKEEINDICI
jgi:D-beta-D-heptose 7-phosphate kinase/D-beta-D-heptose 1-phosphate adenosyltransferase